MICKKCGREYEDDMPKCLWCDAPNDNKVDPSGTNPADGTDPEEAAPLTECEVRGDQAIYWLKAFFFTSLIMIILPITAIYWESTNGPLEINLLGIIVGFWVWLVPLYISALCPPLVLLWPVIALATLASCIFLVISLCKCIYHYCGWLHFSETEQSHFSKMRFSPDVAVIHTVIPVIGPVFQYFIFRDLLTRQKEVLERNHQDCRDLPNWLLPVISASGFIMQSGLLSICILKEWIPIVWFASVLSGIILFVSYIKTIRAITANTRALNSLTTNDAPRDETSKNTLPQENQ
ncbi:hypothetical protein [Fibrobacter sp. UBA4297]|uniref:hypothetical protein n=1 Tax=Fibrobacter sp. UBA4297 TaxID=1946536 RepID=UPI0025C3C1FE|nr:hypothetical protein [Fibrobacter sp. UBA4297]